MCQCFQLRDKDSRIAMLMEEFEGQQNRMRKMKEELADRDAQLRVAKMNLETAEKQAQNHITEA